MFSSFFGKRKSSPVEDEVPPIPGPKSDDGFVVVDRTPTGGLYPNVSGAQYPLRPAPVVPSPKLNTIDQTFHYLQGVPFTMSRELQMSRNKDAYATEIGDLLAFLSNKINISSYEYDFSIEKSVVSEIKMIPYNQPTIYQHNQPRISLH